MLDTNWANISQDFGDHLQRCMEIDHGLRQIIEAISDNNDLVIFGGMIRDYILNGQGFYDHRDIDIVVSNIDDNVAGILESHAARINSFGGYKFGTVKYEIDLWITKETWALKNGYEILLDICLENHLPNTVFFNITAAIYHYNLKRLFYRREFKTALSGDSKTINIINNENPLPELCVVKSLEYFQQGFKLGENLKKYLAETIPSLSRSILQSIQMKHYGELKYEWDEFENFFDVIKKKMEYKEAKKAHPYEHPSENHIQPSQSDGSLILFPPD